jgi:hypothetical protein
MKRIKNFNLSWILSSLVFVFAFTSCNEDDGSNGSGTPPVVESVSPTLGENSEVIPLEPTLIGYANNTYLIQGSGFSTLEKVYFNDFDTNFNPNFVTDNSIFITINRDTPYENASNKLKLVTKFGTTEYDFTVAPPAPGVHSFNPINAADGEQIIIYGSFFLNPVVMVGDVEAEVVSNSLTEITAILPAGSLNKKVSISTISGTVEYGTAVGTALFDDVFYSPWTIESWNNHEFLTDFTQSNQGLTFIAKEMNGFDNIQGNWAWNDQLSNYTGIKFAVKSSEAGKLKLVFNGDWGESRLFDTTTEWQEFTYTWAELGNPAALQNISFQEFSGATKTYYFDNITFTVD